MIDERAVKVARRAFHEWKGKEAVKNKDRLRHAIEAYESAKHYAAGTTEAAPLMGDASTREDEDNGHSPDAIVCRPSPATRPTDAELVEMLFSDSKFHYGATLREQAMCAVELFKPYLKAEG